MPGPRLGISRAMLLFILVLLITLVVKVSSRPSGPGSDQRMLQSRFTRAIVQARQVA